MNIMTKAICIILMGVVVFSHPTQTHAQENVEAPQLEKIQQLLKLIAQLQAQLEKQRAIEDVNNQQQVKDEPEVDENVEIDGVSDIDLSEKYLGFDEEYVAEYALRNTGEIELLDGSAENQHQKIWDLFTLIIGEDYSQQMIYRYHVYDSENSSNAAFLSPVRLREPNWNLSVNIHDVDIEKEKSQKALIETFVHELAHILSLNTNEVKFYEQRYGCDTYFVEFGCARKGSYISEFVAEFWSDDDIAFAKELNRVDSYKEYTKMLKERYEETEGRYVSAYATDDPLEDFAESFTLFVFSNFLSSGTVADEKISFFKQYPEFVLEKNRILKAVSEAGY